MKGAWRVVFNQQNCVIGRNLIDYSETPCAKITSKGAPPVYIVVGVRNIFVGLWTSTHYLSCTSHNATTKTHESLIVILSTVIGSKRRKIKSFWIEPSVQKTEVSILNEQRFYNVCLWATVPQMHDVREHMGRCLFCFCWFGVAQAHTPLYQKLCTQRTSELVAVEGRYQRAMPPRLTSIRIC